jgi:16S rRNA (guanine(966)-N(2))-methyltransferase RsmD
MRPTQAKVKEALFNILAGRVIGARLLDLFAGTGGVGIEALSRGADRVDFVEHHPPTRRILQENIGRCGYQSRARVHQASAFVFLKQAARVSEPFDIVFVDPPYHEGVLKKLLPLLSSGVMIAPSGVMVIEHFHKLALPDEIGALHRSKIRRYGDTVLSFYERPAGENSR